MAAAPAPQPPCHDFATTTAETANYVWANPAVVPAPPVPCWGPRRRCQMSSNKNHNHRQNTGAGAIANPYHMCITCETHAGRMVNNDRRLVTAAANAPFNMRGRPLTGALGAHTRGRLCDRCRDVEIEAYWNRRYVGRKKTEDQAKSTCRCLKLIRKRLCYWDREDVRARIQSDTDRFAGPGGWLEHIDFDPDQFRAVFDDHNANLLAQRRAAGMQDAACRCGRSIARVPAAQQFNVPQPVALCTACSGVIVTPGHPRVRNFPWTTRANDDEQNMDLGRAIPNV